MSYLEELLPEFRKGAKIRRKSWDSFEYIYINMVKYRIADNYNVACEFKDTDILSDEWEIYQEPIDWDYIIKNKCLCWFWDSVDKSGKELGVLSEIRNDERRRYIKTVGKFGIAYEYCRPVRRDEVSFYGDY